MACLLLAAPGTPRAHAGGADAARAEAEKLVARARAYLQRNTIETRRMAAQCLERAVMLAPGHAPYEVALGDLYLSQGFLGQARHAYEAAAVADSANAAAHFGIGVTWRADYLKYLDRLSLERAVDGFSASARLNPSRAETWTRLAPLDFERGDLRSSSAAASRALEADPDSPDALLAVAHSAYHGGELEKADTYFRRALPGLDPEARQCFEKIDPVATEQDTAALRRLPTPEARAEFVRRFWRALDPDLATEVNEAQLAFWARASQAYFLFYDRRRREWDMRGEVYVRYGPPEKAEYEPVVKPYMESIWSLRFFPFNTLVWSYPGLGMTVAMTDRTLNGTYDLPASLLQDMDPRPDPDSLRRRDPEMLAGPQGRGVFPRLPPGARALPLWAATSRFRAGDAARTRLVASVVSPGGPAESLACEVVVLDSTLHEVARAARVLGASACDPAAERQGEFAFDLASGEYLLGVSLRDGAGGRGAWRAPLTAPAAPGRLEISDLEIACGPPPVAGDPLFRIAANPAGKIPAQDPVGVYFEIYGLRPGPDGLARYSLEYTVRSAARDERPWISRVFARRPALPSLSALREDEHAGTLRRQYVSIPAQSLPAGRYRLLIRLRDELAQDVVEREAYFEKI